VNYIWVDVEWLRSHPGNVVRLMQERGLIEPVAGLSNLLGYSLVYRSKAWSRPWREWTRASSRRPVSSAKVWLGRDGWTDITLRGDDIKVYINGQLAGEADHVQVNLEYAVGSVSSTLRVHVAGGDNNAGWTHLVVDSEGVIVGHSGDDITLSNLHLDDTVSLNIHQTSGHAVYVDATGSPSVNGAVVSAFTTGGTTAIGLLGLLALSLGLIAGIAARH
jgi:hypothetical protein